MTNTGKKLIALMVALMMLFSIIPTFAEAPAGENPFEKILKSGKNLKSEISIQLNPQIGYIIALMNGENMPDEKTQQAFQLISDALKKVKATFVASATAASGVIGTDKGELGDLQISYNEDGSDLKMTSSLLPGVFMTVDPEMMAQYTNKANAQNMSEEELMKKVQPYLSVLTEEVDKVQKAAGSEEGNYDTPYGAFNKRTKVTLTSHMLGGLLLKLGEVYSKDTELQAMVKEIAVSSEGMNVDMLIPQEGEEVAPEEYKDPILGMLESIQESLTKEEESLFDLTVFENEGSAYFDLATLPENPQPMNIRVYTGKKDETTTDLEVKLLQGGYRFAAEGETLEPIDWAVLEQSALAGTDPAAGVLSLKINAVNENESKIATTLAISFASGGVAASISAKTSANIETLESDSEFAVYMMGEEPLLKVVIHAVPTDDQPVAPVVEGMKELVLKEEMSEEDQAILEKAAAGIGPALLEKLSVILPDEFPAIMELIMSSTEGQDDSAMLEPSVETEGELEAEVETEAEVESESK